MAGPAAGAIGHLGPQMAALFVCDVQERCREEVDGFPAVERSTRRMLRAAEVLSLPLVLVTRHRYKEGGHHAEHIQGCIPDGAAVLDKVRLSMVVPETEQRLAARPAVRAVLLMGVEAHECLLQTALDLLERGYAVHVLADGVSARRLGDREVALRRLAQVGALLATTEMALCQLVRSAGAAAVEQLGGDLAPAAVAAACQPG